jgi:hypothetical protein
MTLIKKLFTAAVSTVIAAAGVCSALPTDIATYADSTVLGDANEDGVLNIRDAAFIANKLAGIKAFTFSENTDYNMDGTTNIRDAAAIARHLASLKPVYTVLWAVLPQVDSSYGKNSTLKSSLSDSSVERIKEIADLYEKKVEELSNNAVDVQVDVVVSQDSVSTLTEYVDDSYYIDCYDLPPDIMNMSDNYDCVLSCASLANEDGNSIGSNYWGLSTIDKTTYGWSYAFVQIIGGDYLLYEDSGYNPEEVWVHEWLHTLEGRMSSYNTIPSADASEYYGYKSAENNSFYEYYRDILTCNVTDPISGEKLGMSKEAWNHISD